MLRQFSSKNISNHLQLLWLLRLYRNANDEWRKHYRAVAVAQLRRHCIQQISISSESMDLSVLIIEVEALITVFVASYSHTS